MFITNIHGKESITARAAELGCKAGECVHGSGYGRPALAGNTFCIKDQLKAAGARWDGECKAWAFDSWDALEAAINSIGA